MLVALNYLLLQNHLIQLLIYLGLLMLFLIKNLAPFMIWTSDRYKATHPETCNDLAKALHRPMMLDNVCQILFRIGGVDTSFYQPQRDVTHPLYHPGKRLIRGQFYYEDMMSAHH